MSGEASPRTDADPIVRTIETRTHGRYLVRPAQGPPPSPVLIGFHGYGEDAGTHLDALATIPGVEPWLLVSVQALHRFYQRQERVVASWMTRQDRELAISDNIEYVRRILARLDAEHAVRAPRVFAGFSQGGAMAYRAAAHLGADGVIVLGSDLPPDVAGLQPQRLSRVLIGRGTGDSWYNVDRQAADVGHLRASGVLVETCTFDGGHEWAPAFAEAAGRMLAGLLHRRAAS